MAYPVNALSFGPLSGQVHITSKNEQQKGIPYTISYTHDDAPPPNLNNVAGGVTANSSEQRDHDQSTDTAISKAFAAASLVLEGQDKAETVFVWQPTVHHNPEHTSRSSRKRDAATAGLAQPVVLENKPKIAKTISKPTVKKLPGRPLGSSTSPKKIATPKTPVLRTNKPLEAQVPLDVWDQIIRYSTLPCAITISKVSKDHRALLSKSSLWKAVRHNVYGPDHPDPPPGMTERRYADLLVGSGCQTKGCKNNRAKQTCWAFQRRWCVSCLRKKTVSVDSCDAFLKRYPQMAKCVPRIDLGHFTLLKDDSQNSPSWIGFLRTDLARAADAFDEAEKQFGCCMKDIESNVALQAWLDDKAKAKDVFVEKLQSIENWAIAYKGKVREEAALKKQELSNFFAGKALSMDPPLDLPALEQLECFRHAIVSKSKPSKRAWKLLEKKIQSEQQRQRATTTRAQDCLQYDLEMLEEEDVQQRLNPEGELENDLLERADAIVNKMFDDEEPFSPHVRDGDFVRILLKTLFVQQQQFKAENDPYLTMDHAKLVYNNILKPFIAEFQSEDKQRALAQLICPACKDHNPPKQEDFIGLMNHIWNQHLEQGPGSEDSNLEAAKRTHTTFPWNRFKWPLSLPILAVGQMASGSKIRMTRPARELCAAASKGNEGPGAFDDRVAATHIGQGKLDFAENVLFAASLLEETSLEDIYRTQIAFEYGCQRLSKRSLPPPARFEELQMALIRNGISGLFEGFRCQKCCEAAREGRAVGYFARSVKPLAKLGEHYFSKHNPATWSQEMLNLPSPQELLTQLGLPRNQKAYSIFLQLFPTQADVALDPRLQGDPTEDSDMEEEEGEEGLAEEKDTDEEDGEEEQSSEEDEASEEEDDD